MFIKIRSSLLRAIRKQHPPQAQGSGHSPLCINYRNLRNAMLTHTFYPSEDRLRCELLHSELQNMTYAARPSPNFSGSISWSVISWASINPFKVPRTVQIMHHPGAYDFSGSVFNLNTLSLSASHSRLWCNLTSTNGKRSQRKDGLQQVFGASFDWCIFYLLPVVFASLKSQAANNQDQMLLLILRP